MEVPVVRVDLKQSDLLSGVGFLHQRSVSETFQIHTHSFFEFFFVLKGKAIHHINGEREILSRGDLVLIRPNDVHYYSFLDHYDMELLTCGIENAMMEDACRYLRISPEDFMEANLPIRIRFDDSDYWPVAEAFLGIGKRTPGMERRRYMLSLLPELLYRMLHAEPNQHLRLPSWLTKLVAEMEKPENFVEGLPRMIELPGVTQEHMTRVFKKHMEMTPTQFISLKRINYSADLLRNGETDILDVCYRSGFKSVSSFYQAFKKNYHCTPSKFLRSNE